MSFAHAGLGFDFSAPWLRAPASPWPALIAPMPPMAWPQMPFLPFTSPKAVVQQHVSGAGRIGTTIIADHGVEAENALSPDRISNQLSR